MAIKERERCGSCKFGQDFGEGQHLKCRRFPPQGGFPTVNPESWCGEWSAKQEQ